MNGEHVFFKNKEMSFIDISPLRLTNPFSQKSAEEDVIWMAINGISPNRISLLEREAQLINAISVNGVSIQPHANVPGY